VIKIIDEYETFLQIIKVSKVNATVSSVSRICECFLSDTIVLSIQNELNEIFTKKINKNELVSTVIENLSSRVEKAKETTQSSNDPE